ncbi:putative serpin-Z8 [Lolium rigidum]|uniref:putative serpin-Z8 n=1 Tax=Lolium rigidum TaxID=89674 RepID=UPI001F5CF766|nr:putative serpin-Z8 [Lolium rigidum]
MDLTGDLPTQPGSRGLAMLAAGIARSLAKENAGSNLILRVLGARSRGELDEFVSGVAEQVFEDHSGYGGPRVAFACGVWSDLTCPLKPAFREAVVGTYKTEASTVDFTNEPEAARDQINAWVAQVTQNLIGSVFGPEAIKPLTRVVLGNAMYFKGSWAESFDKMDTTNKLFHRLDGSTVDVPFMQSWDRQYIAVHDGFKVLKLHDHSQYDETAHPAGHPYFSNLTPSGTPTPYYVPYRRNKRTQFSMCIFLPDAVDGLRSLVDTIASQPGFMHQHLPKNMLAVSQFRLPKFKLSFQGSIVAILKNLGLQLPFGDLADLSDMVEDNESGLPLEVSEVIHKAAIEVNEEGTEAAAASVMNIQYGCSAIPPPSPPRVDFVADHSFVYFIVEEDTGVVVFAGHVLDPSKEN